jgi:hypothetical protein
MYLIWENGMEDEGYMGTKQNGKCEERSIKKTYDNITRLSASASSFRTLHREVQPPCDIGQSAEGREPVAVSYTRVVRS